MELEKLGDGLGFREKNRGESREEERGEKGRGKESVLIKKLKR